MSNRHNRCWRAGPSRPRITSDSGLSLFSAAGGATPAIWGDDLPDGQFRSGWQPTKPGPQAHNAGVTPGHRKPRPDDAEPVTRGELRRLRRAVRRALRNADAATAEALRAALRKGGAW